VWEPATPATCSGVPWATSRPPASPPSGPRSTTQSAALITSRLCSITTRHIEYVGDGVAADLDVEHCVVLPSLGDVEHAALGKARDLFPFDFDAHGASSTVYLPLLMMGLGMPTIASAFSSRPLRIGRSIVLPPIRVGNLRLTSLHPSPPTVKRGRVRSSSGAAQPSFLFDIHVELLYTSREMVVAGVLRRMLTAESRLPEDECKWHSWIGVGSNS
jgi:hypothetical protein